MKSQSILDLVLHHKSIPQIWWNELIPHIITNYEPRRNEMMMNQLIQFHKPNKKVRSEKTMDYLIPQTKHAVNAHIEGCQAGEYCITNKLQPACLAGEIRSVGEPYFTARFNAIHQH